MILHETNIKIWTKEPHKLGMKNLFGLVDEGRASIAVRASKAQIRFAKHPPKNIVTAFSLKENLTL